MENKIMNGGTSATIISHPLVTPSLTSRVQMLVTPSLTSRVQMLVTPSLTSRVQMPMPREFNGKLYYGVADVAKIIGVTQQTISRWQTTLYFDCPLFTADARAHDGRYLYEVERVMQLAAVYRPNWTRGSYEPPIENAIVQKVSLQTEKRLKWIEPVYLCNKDVVTKSTASKAYECPFCGGNMTSHIGVGTADSQGFIEWHCNKCGGVFDNIDLLAKSYNLNRDADFFEICQRACEQFGRPFETESVDDTATEVNIPALPMKESPTAPSTKPDFTLQRQSLDDAKLALKSIPPEQLGSQFLQPAKNGGYICPNPNCRDGSGRDGTGMTHYVKTNGTHEYYCGKCARGYDNVAILGFYFGLDPNRQFREIIQRADNYFDLPAIYDSRADFKPVEDKPVVPDQHKQFILDANRRLKEFVDSQGGTWRALTFDTLNKFKVGFDPRWYARKGAPTTPRVIIPTSYNHFLARLIGKLTDFTIPNGVHLDEKEHRGHKEIFNFKRAILDAEDPIIFAVEGEIDAMSIYQASEGKINVIAIGGSDLATNLERQLQTATAGKNFVIMLDNDETGKKKAPILAAKFQALGHKAVVRFLSDTYNDANDFLQADANGLASRLQALYDDVKAAFDTLPAPPQIDAPAPATCVIQPVAIEDKQLPPVDAKIKLWQDNNGNIDPNLLPKIKEYKAYLESLTVDKITSEIAQSSNVKAALGACTFYDFFVSTADEFIARLREAKTNAANEIKRLKDEGGDFVKIPADLQALAGLTLSNFKEQIAQYVTDFKKAHKAFTQAERERLLKEREEQRKAERQAQYDRDSDQLARLQRQPPSPERDAAIVETIKSMCDWKHDKFGNPVCVKATQDNADLIFTYDPNISGLIGFDEFRQVDVFLKKAPWGNPSPVGAEFSDRDESKLCTYLRRNYKEFYSKELIQQSVISYSDEKSFHVVKDFFNGLPQWDGVKRAETLFIDKLAVEDTPYARAVTKNWLIAAVARIFHPGCSYDLAPILLGKQGIGKSLILKKLGGKWYGALLDDAGDSHALDAIDVLWLVEIKEMASMKKDSDNNKRFIDNSADTRRKAYGRRATTVGRHCVFMCSTNREQCLIDQTGNRRYPILQCRRAQNDAAAVQAMTDDEIKQIWAEVYHLYQELFKDGFDDKLLVLEDEFKTQVDVIAAEHLRDDGIQGEIQAYLDTPIPEQFIWDLFNRDERRNFFINGELRIDAEALRARFKSRMGNRDSEREAKFDEATTPRDGVVKRVFVTRKDESTFWQLTFYGARLREHVAAIEIYTEYFANSDKRKTMPRISEALEKIDDWQKGKRIGRDPAYGDLKTVYYRKSETKLGQPLDNK